MTRIAGSTGRQAERDLPLTGWLRWLAVGGAALGVIADLAVRELVPDAQTPPDHLLLACFLALAVACFGWFPRLGTFLLILGLPLGILAGDISSPILVATLAVGLVVATTARAIAIAYCVLYVAGVMGVGVAQVQSWTLADSVLTLLIGTASFGVGVGARRIRSNEQRMAERVEQVEVLLEEAKRCERVQIADELHDLIIRDLTVIAMHARVLGRSRDPEQVESSRGAIEESSRRALADLRRVLRLVRGDASELDDGVPLLGPALHAAQAELAALGIAAEVEADPELVEGLSPTASASFARALREAVANVTKHAPASRVVRVRLWSTSRGTVLEVANAPAPGTETAPSRAVGPSGLPAGGYGLARLTERFRALGGAITAGPADAGGWRVSARLPA